MSTQKIVAKLEVEDHATGALGKIAHAAEHASEKILHFGGELTKFAGIAGGVGVALNFWPAVESTEKYMSNLKEIGELTGMAADKTDYLLSEARRAGVEYDTMQQIVFKLSRRGAMVESAINGSNDAAKTLGMKFKRLGVDVTKGPVESMEQMSKLIQQGKLETDDLMGRFGIPAKAANDFKEFLETMGKKNKGEKLTEFAKKFQAMKKGGELVTEDDINRFKQIEQLKHQVNDGFNRIKLMIGKEIYPIIVDMLQRFTDTLPGWIARAREFGQTLKDHIGGAIILAKVLGKILIANALIGKLTGGKQNIIGLTKALPSMGVALANGIAAKLPALGQVGAGVGMRVMGAAAGSGGLAAAGPAATALGTLAGSLTVILPVVLAVAAVVAVLALAFKGFQKNVGGATDVLMSIWDRFVAKFEIIGEKIGELLAPITKLFGGGGGKGMGLIDQLEYLASMSFNALFASIDRAMNNFLLVGYLVGEVSSVFAEFGKTAGTIIKVGIFDPFMTMLDRIGQVIQAILAGNFGDAVRLAKSAFNAEQQAQAGVGALVASAVQSMANGLQRATDKRDIDVMYRARANALERMAKGNKTEQEARAPKTEMNFPNARFDITQNFAEGFDPDRIAVAFANDISSLGDLRTQSGLAPAFGGR